MKSQFAELYEKTLRSFKEGEVVRGHVITVRSDSVVVDIGYKSEGFLSLDEFIDPSSVTVGTEIDVLFEGFDDEHGTILISKRKADRQKIWNDLLSTAQEGTIVEGRIFRKVRGGFMVDVGMEAFLPASLVDIKPTRNLDQFLGMTSKFVIAKINHKRKNIVVSRKDYLDQQREKAKSGRLATLAVGQIVKGRVKNITDFGVFLDLGELDGLLHITDMSWGRISHPSEMAKIGDELEVVVIAIDMEKRKVSLGLKQKMQSPWEKAADKYFIGNQVKGRVVNILPYGAFVELEPGIEGLVHISELSWTKRVNHPSEILQTGDEVEVVVLSIDPASKKISLGMKQIQENPWTKIKERFKEGDQVKGTVRNIMDYGAFVEIEPGIDGLVHISDISWTHKVNHPSDFLKKGQEVEVKVLAINEKDRKISLGIKQLSQDPWDQLTRDLIVGLQVSGKISRIANYGVFVELENGLEGLVHISEMPHLNPSKLDTQFRVGDAAQVSVLHVDHESRKIALTMKEDTVSAKTR
ncbi:MAG: 30S ribosomal protein S1 [Candidatus Omnitrophota bacterium]